MGMRYRIGPMTQRDPQQRDDLEVLAALQEPVRRALFELVTKQDRPVSRDEAAEALDIRRSTAAFHLDRLAADGLLDVEYRRLSGKTGPGAGRTAKLYRRSSREVTASLPPRRYDLAGSLLAGAVDESNRTGEPVLDVLSRKAAAAGHDIGGAAETAESALLEHGFTPRSEPDGDVSLRNCPFHQLAQVYTKVVCGMNLSFVQGIVQGAGQDRAVTLDPGPDRCCVLIAKSA